MVRMLVATDGSPHAAGAAKLAAWLAGELRETEVILITVGHIPAMALGTLAEGVVDLKLLEESLRQTGRAILNEAERVFDKSGARVTRMYAQGEPSVEIIEKARQHKVDLIVMGRRGLGQIGGLILGSVSERVLHGAHVPVLIIR
jgi:nucleotide-binding universal stress UspA family protein